MKAKLAAGILAIGLVLPGIAGAQADLDCWMEAPLQTMATTGDTTDTITEYIVLYCKNKGDQTATSITCTFDAPQYTYPNSTTPLFSAGDLAVDETATVTMTLLPGDSIEAGTTLAWGLTCTYDNGPGAGSVDVSADTFVMPEVKYTLITSHDAFYASYHPSGSKIVYAERNSGRGDLFVYDIDSGDSVQLTFDGNNYCDSKPSFSPDGDKIVWQRQNACGYSSIWVMNLDGSTPYAVLDPMCGGECYAHPHWTPDGKIIAHRDALNSPDTVETVNGIYDGYYGPMWYVVNADGTGMQRITPMRDEGWTPQADTRQGEILVRGGYLNWSSTPNLFGFDSNVEEGEALYEITGYGPTKMGAYRPLSDQLAYSDGIKDGYNIGQIFLSNLDNTNKLCLTCSKRVEEYQRSDDADTITLDYGGSSNPILDVEGVWRVDDPPPDGNNYFDAELPGGLWSNQINLPEPLDASSPSARVPVLVTYRFVDNPNDCYSRPHFSLEGNVVAYQKMEYDNGYQQAEVWLSDITGDIRARLTYKGAYNISNAGQGVTDNFNTPIISPRGDSVLFNWNHCIYLLSFPESVWTTVNVPNDEGGDETDVDDGGGEEAPINYGKKKDDDDKEWYECGTMTSGVPGIFGMLIMGLPIAVGLGARTVLRRRK